MSNARNLAKAGASAVGGMAPTGVVLPFAGSTAPTGWLLCNGSAVSRTTYADLFTAISTTYGTGDGTTTFNLPDLGGRVPAGKEATATRLTTGGSGVNGATLGASGGSESHTLSSAQIPSHTHTGSTNTIADHTHGGIVTGTGSVTNITNTAGGSATAGSVNTSGSTAAGGSHTHTVTVNANTGGDGAHNNTQPTIVLNYIIKT